MISWFWSLEGWPFVGALLTGLAMTVGTILGLVLALARSVAGFFEHDQQNCGCGDCQRIRGKALDKLNRQRARARHRPLIRAGDYISTMELEYGMVVSSRNNAETYLFQGKIQRGPVYTVTLTNLATDKRAWVAVPIGNVHRKIWKVADMGVRDVIGL